MWPFKKTEKRDYTDQLVAGLVARAEGDSKGATAAQETACGQFARAFAVAEVEGGERFPDLNPNTLAYIGRGLIRHGEVLFLIALEGDAAIRLRPAAWYELEGKKELTGYRLTLMGASDSETLSGVNPDRVIHIKYATRPTDPYRGVGPLDLAKLGGQLSSEVSQSLKDEAAGTRGMLLPVPKPGDDSTLAAFEERPCGHGRQDGDGGKHRRRVGRGSRQRAAHGLATRPTRRQSAERAGSTSRNRHPRGAGRLRRSGGAGGGRRWRRPARGVAPISVRQHRAVRPIGVRRIERQTRYADHVDLGRVARVRFSGANPWLQAVARGGRRAGRGRPRRGAGRENVSRPAAEGRE